MFQSTRPRGARRPYYNIFRFIQLHGGLRGRGDYRRSGEAQDWTDMCIALNAHRLCHARMLRRSYV